MLHRPHPGGARIPRRRGIPGARTLRRAAAGLATLVIGATASGCAAGGGDPALPAPHVAQPAASSDLNAQDVDAWLDGMLPAALERSGIPGATISVVHDGEILTARGYGHADTGRGTAEAVAVDPERTLFRTGSVSKLATATAVMQLVESGDLDLDTDIGTYLDFELPRSFDADITLRHLLTHTGGFEERVKGLIRQEGAPTDLGASLAEDPPEQVYRPGTQPAYSNYGLGLAGHLVELVSGMSFEDYTQQHVLDPLGMDSATFRQPLPEDLAPQAALGYTTAADDPAAFEIVTPAPAGSLTASAVDMARFMLGHLGGQPGGTPVLDPETLELMHAPALDESTLGGFAAGARMTLGFFDESRNGHRILGHGGDTQYFHSALEIYPEDATGIFVSLNGSGTGVSSLDLRRDLLTGFSDRYFPAGEVGDAPTSITAAGSGPSAEESQERAALAAGSYESTRGFHSTFLTAIGLIQPTTVTALADGRILLQPDPGTAVPTVYEEISPWLWQESGGYRLIAMRVDDGEVVGMAHDSAMSLQRIDGIRAALMPALGVSAALLALLVIAWPALALRRRRLRALGIQTPAVSRSRALRWSRRASRVGALAALLALAGWASASVMAMSLQDVPTAMLRLLQLLQWTGAAAVVPAGLALVAELRQRTGWRYAITGALLLLALLGMAWSAWQLNLLSPDLSY